MMIWRGRQQARRFIDDDIRRRAMFCRFSRVRRCARSAVIYLRFAARTLAARKGRAAMRFWRARFHAALMMPPLMPFFIRQRIWRGTFMLTPRCQHGTGAARRIRHFRAFSRDSARTRAQRAAAAFFAIIAAGHKALRQLAFLFAFFRAAAASKVVLRMARRAASWPRCRRLRGVALGSIYIEAARRQARRAYCCWRRIPRCRQQARRPAINISLQASCSCAPPSCAPLPPCFLLGAHASAFTKPSQGDAAAAVISSRRHAREQVRAMRAARRPCYVCLCREAAACAMILLLLRAGDAFPRGACRAFARRRGARRYAAQRRAMRFCRHMMIDIDR